MRNVNDQELIQKVITKTEKTRNKIKRTIDNYEKKQIVRITNHIQHLKTVIISSTNHLQDFRKVLIKKYGKQKQSY